MLKLRTLALVIAFTAAACGTRNTPGVIPPGPSAFREGYADGCDSGEREGGNPWQKYRRDWGAYQSDPVYRQGWEEGHSACFANYNAIKHW